MYRNETLHRSPPVAMPENEYRLVRTAFEFLNRGHRSKVGDLYCVYILLALAMADRSSAALQAHEPRKGLNLLSLSAMTHVPRETVRRKLKLLIGMEMVEETSGKAYALTDTLMTRQVLAPLSGVQGLPHLGQT